MAFKEWSTASSDELTPWADKYVLANPHMIGTVHDVVDVKIKQKGLVLECREVAGWVFKSKTLHLFILQFIEQWHKAKGGAPVLQLKLTDAEPNWIIGVEEERRACWGKATDATYWHQGYMTSDDNPALSANPLPLPPAAPTPTSEVARMTDALPDMHDLLPLQMSPDLPLNGSLSGVEGVSGRKSRKTNQEPS